MICNAKNVTAEDNHNIGLYIQTNNMRKFVLVLLASLTLCVVQAQDYEASFKRMQRLFQERHTTAIDSLENYLDTYKYAPYVDEIELMRAVLLVEKDKFKPALKILEEINPKNLFRESEDMFYFYKGYTLLNLEKHEEALKVLKPLKTKQNPYFLQATYYIGYCYFKMGNMYFPQALSEFLSLEGKGYSKMVPYHILQIHYVSGEYDKVYKLAEELLRKYPDNDYNYEIHRIVGEIYYQNGIYNDAIRHLKAYQELTQKKPARRKEIQYNDLYLLGISCYKEQQFKDAIYYLNIVAEHKLTPDSIAESTRLHLGHAYLCTNDLEKAKHNYAKAITYKVNDRVREEAMYNYVQVTYTQNLSLGENIQAFKDFINEYPNSKYIDKVYSLMAEMYLHSTNYTAAIEALEEIQQPDDNTRNTLQILRYKMAVEMYVQKKYNETLDWCKIVISNEKGESIYKTEAYYLKAESEYYLKDYGLVLKSLNEYKNSSFYAQSLNKQNAEYLKAYAYFNTKKYQSADAAFKTYLQTVDPTDNTYADALNRRGDCYFYQRKFNTAIELYQETINIGKYGADYAMMQQGMVYGLMHQYDKKIEVLEQFVKTYPKSDQMPYALYELARAELQGENYEQAIVWYEQLIKNRKHKLHRKALLELGMARRSIGQFDEAIKAFKETISRYSTSEEAYSALDAMEQIYVENNRVAEYIDYTKTIRLNTTAASQEDSLIYVTAELQYIIKNYQEAAAGFSTYIARFCPGGRSCTNAIYYSANCYYQLQQYDQAIEQYHMLLQIEGTPYKELACTRLAEMCYDKKDYKKALYYFEELQELASSQQISHAALLGKLRCSHYINNIETTIQYATEMLQVEELDKDTRIEALYYRASANMRLEQYQLAIEDYSKLAQNVRTAWGAESKYRLAECHYKLGDLVSSEEEIMSFTKMQTTHQYWLAKSLILLADINVDIDDLFQAKQYLLALQNNYKQKDDDILNIVQDRIEFIDKLELVHEDNDNQ